MIPVNNSDVLVYSRIAANLLKKLSGVDEDTLTGESSTEQKLELILEAFQHIDLIAEERYKKLHEHKPEHLPEDSGAVN